MSAEAKRIATEETLAARSPVVKATPASRDLSSPAPEDRTAKSDPLFPDISVIHDTKADRPTPSTQSSSPQHWDSTGQARLKPQRDGSEQHPPVATHMAQARTAAPPAPAALKDDESKLSSRESAVRLLNHNEKVYRGVVKTYDGQKDDGKHLLHGLRFAPAPHTNPADMYTLGLKLHRTKAPPAFYHDLSHLEGGLMINARAFVLANSISDANLPLEVFRPGTLSMPESDRPVADMKEVQKSFSIYQALSRRSKPWDHSLETLNDFLIEVEWFSNIERPVCGYYRRPSYPAYRAVADLIVAVNRSVVQLLPIRATMLDTTEVRRIHSQRASEMPEYWSHTPATTTTRSESSRREKTSTTTSRRTKTAPSASVAKDVKSKVKDAVSRSSEPVCIAYNLGSSCPRPASGGGCSFTKNGVTSVLDHSCAWHDATGTRCRQKHPMAKNH